MIEEDTTNGAKGDTILTNESLLLPRGPDGTVSAQDLSGFFAYQTGAPVQLLGEEALRYNPRLKRYIEKIPAGLGETVRILDGDDLSNYASTPNDFFDPERPQSSVQFYGTMEEYLTLRKRNPQIYLERRSLRDLHDAWFHLFTEQLLSNHSGLPQIQLSTSDFGKSYALARFMMS